MKTLQNSYTTQEQSKRLLELGIPEDSADCYLLRTHTKGDTFIVEVLHDELYSKKDKFTNMLEYLPCWSVGRLMEIYDICVNLMPGMQLEFGKRSGNCTYIELIIASFELAADDGLIYFSNLEE